MKVLMLPATTVKSADAFKTSAGNVLVVQGMLPNRQQFALVTISNNQNAILSWVKASLTSEGLPHSHLINPDSWPEVHKAEVLPGVYITGSANTGSTDESTKTGAPLSDAPNPSHDALAAPNVAVVGNPEAEPRAELGKPEYEPA